VALKHIEGEGRRTVRSLAASVRERIARGEAKEAIYAELRPQYYESDALAALIARVPSPADVQAMRPRNACLLGLMYARVGLGLVGIGASLSMGLPDGRHAMEPLFALFRTGLILWLTFGIRTYSWQCYWLLGMVSLYEAVAVTATLVTGAATTAFDWGFGLVALAITSGIAFLALSLKREFYPHLGLYGVKTVGGRFILGPPSSRVASGGH
jgi:hypothetical protein